ncbi:hypothetical protein AL061_03635 [Pseudomonas syringae pv. syringae]|jgi:hypothetical protein|nr:hypothetical protein AL061_03635 [Pseudomonas syringae pv. syringae]
MVASVASKRLAVLVGHLYLVQHPLPNDAVRLREIYDLLSYCMITNLNTQVNAKSHAPAIYKLMR